MKNLNLPQFDESESTVRLLNFLRANGHDMNNDANLELQLRRLLLNDKMLWDSGFFTGGRMDWTQVLKSTPPGTFFIRYSSDPSCLYTLTFRSDRYALNPVSHMRLEFVKSWFTLFGNLRLGYDVGHYFETVLDLVEHYRIHPPTAWTVMPDFRKPFYFKPPSLKHMCMRFIAGRMKSTPRALTMLAIENLGLEEQLTDEVKANILPLEFLYERSIREGIRRL